MTQPHSKASVFILFTTILMDLIGFGMIIPLTGLYGRHWGAQGLELALLGSIYSLMQFVFAPIWGALSDQWGRRPILLLSLAGSSLSYLLFGLATSYPWLLLSRAFGGLCAANISTAQAYIADITTPQNRAQGMGMMGAAFGIGFTLGPPLGGLAANHLGLSAPGLIAATICSLNLVLAIFRLPESLSLSRRARPTCLFRSPLPLNSLKTAMQHPKTLGFFLILFFGVTFAFSMMEQTFSLLFQYKFQLNTQEASLKTGLVLMMTGLLGVFIQGILLRRLVTYFSEKKLILTGLCCNFLVMTAFPLMPYYELYFLLAIPLALGSGLINPNLSALISQSASVDQQGSTLGLSQGLSSLARALGPFLGLVSFTFQPHLPYWLASSLTLCFLILSFKLLR